MKSSNTTKIKIKQKQQVEKKKNLSSITVAAVNVDVNVDGAVAAADPIRKFNYICATDTSCYADVIVVVLVVVAAFGFSKPARRKQSERSAAQRRQRQQRQRQRRRRSAKKQQIVHAHCYAAALSGAALRCMYVCVSIGACQHNYVRNVHTRTHTHTQGATGRKAFALKVFLDEFRAPFFFSIHAHTHTSTAAPSLSHTHRHIKLHRQRGDIKTNKEIRVKTKIKLIRNKYCVHTRILRDCICACACVCAYLMQFTLKRIETADNNELYKKALQR